MFLLDTVLLLDLRRGAARGAPEGLLAWAESIARQRLFLSAVSLLELEQGAASASRRGKELGAAWRHWIDRQLLPAFDGRVLPIDAVVARKCAETARLDARDALIAATALENGLTLATYEITRFRPARLKTFDPRQYSAEGESDWREAARAGSHWFKHLFVRA